MRGSRLFAMGIVMACILSGCGSPESISQSESMQQGTVEPESPEELTQLQTTPSEAAVELSDGEKEFFTDFIQEYENYGFLLSYYEVPEDVNLSEVLYGGAGFGEPIPEEDVSLYLAAVQRESVETDCLKFTRQDIQEFLQRKLGIGLEDIRAPFEWPYISETDAYYKESGDTNYARFFCVEGTRQGDTYTLRFSPEEDWAYWYGDCETVLVQTEEGYRFLSNRALGE